MGRFAWVRAVVALVAVVVVAVGSVVAPRVLAGPPAAGAVVEHGQGFAAMVDGDRSWFGSYRLGGPGEVWCVDHGIAAPDEALGYEPTGLEDHAPETRRAIAWAVGRHGVGVDRVGAAALMLVLHDLMGARYPSGPLSVDTLTPDRLAGFEGREAEVLDRARAIKADAVARAGLVGPLSLSISVYEAVAGDRGELRASVVDANGVGIGGVLVRPAVTGAELDGAVDRVTSDDGSVAWPFTAGPGPNGFHLEAAVPGAELVALRPTVRAAQRVARPASAVLVADASYEAKVRKQLTIVKHGEAGLPVAGARFRVAGVDADLVVGDDGRTLPIALLPGAYEVMEVEPPPGYDVAGPWTVVVNDADVVLDVHDPATPGWIDLVKVDATTGAVLDGAEFDVVRASDGEQIVDTAAPLLPGTYRIRERVAPPHHRASHDEWTVEVRPGERTAVSVPNLGLATVAFQKRPALTGATFAVASAEGPELGRCTTDADGHCALPDDSLEAGTKVCWKEVAAPAGWAAAEGACLEVGDAGSVTTVDVDEHELPPPATTTTTTTAPPAAPPPPPDAQPADQPPAPIDTEVLATPMVTRSAPELPRTGPTATRSLAGAAFVLLGVGLALVIAGRGGSRQARYSSPPPATQTFAR